MLSVMALPMRLIVASASPYPDAKRISQERLSEPQLRSQTLYAVQFSPCPQYRLWRSFRWISVEIVGIFHMFSLWTLTPTRCNTIKEGIKLKLTTITTVGAAIALIGFCCAVLLDLPTLFYPVLIAWLIGAAALIADIFRPDVRLRRWRFEN